MRTREEQNGSCHASQVSEVLERWRTGFYHIARGAGVPILSVALNYGVRAIQIGPLFTTTGDMERDVTELQQEFANVNGRKPTA